MHFSKIVQGIFPGMTKAVYFANSTKICYNQLTTLQFAIKCEEKWQMLIAFNN